MRRSCSAVFTVDALNVLSVLRTLSSPIPPGRQFDGGAQLAQRPQIRQILLDHNQRALTVEDGPVSRNQVLCAPCNVRRRSSVAR